MTVQPQTRRESAPLSPAQVPQEPQTPPLLPRVTRRRQGLSRLLLTDEAISTPAYEAELAHAVMELEAGKLMANTSTGRAVKPT
jgi:hypothetical protein